MPVSVKVGGVWKTATAVYNKVGGVWKTASDMPVKVAGVWKTGILESGAYESIATISGDGASTSITFSSIPSTYKALQLRIFANTTAGTGNGSLRFNGDSTTGNYAHHQLETTGNLYANGASNDNNISAAIYCNAGPNLYYGVSIIDIIDYSSTSKLKTVSIFGGQSTQGTDGLRVLSNSGLWKSTAAINSLTIFFPAGRNITTNSRFALYGIKG